MQAQSLGSRAARWFAVALLLSSLAAAAHAQQAAPLPAELAAHLAAGEFGLAQALARGAPAPQRDAWLGQIADSQAAAGSWRGSLATVDSIADPRARNDAYLRIANRGPGLPPLLGAGLQGGGGGPQADFDSLIDLITSTVAPTTWDTNGGPGAIDGFEGGVFVDPRGVLRQAIAPGAHVGLAAVRSAAMKQDVHDDVRQPSDFRKVSLVRLERQLQRWRALGQRPDPTLAQLAGLQRATHLLVYPEQGDIVLAGPAGDWRYDAEGRAVSVDTGAPCVRLDDLLVVLRHALSGEGRFGCSITPRKANLAAAKAHLEQWAATPLRPGQRDAWLTGLRDALGRQDIEVYGLAPDTRAARVMVEADYRMKLVGMGLEEGVIGVESYLSTIEVPANGAAPPMDVLRWWFTLNYRDVACTPDRLAFQLRGQGVQVLSENELLTAQGERQHTGRTDELNRRFAASFTQQFPLLAAKHPIYAELRNVFDLALLCEVLRGEDLPGQVGWTPTLLLDDEGLPVERGPAPVEVDTVVNHRLIGQKHIVAGVSGGVRCDPRARLASGSVKIVADDYGLLKAARGNSAAAPVDRDRWWWD